MVLYMYKHDSSQCELAKKHAFTYEAAEISQAVQMIVAGTDPNGDNISPIAIDIQVKVPDSESWVPLSGVGIDVVINGADPNPSHLTGYYGTIFMKFAMAFMETMYLKNLTSDPDYTGNIPPAPILSQGASLPWGGLYDINKNWMISHCGHRDGKTIDISLSTLSRVKRKALDSAIRDAELRKFDESDHWHVTLKK